MGISRYSKTKKINNGAWEYRDILQRRGRDEIRQYSFEKFKALKLKDVPNLTITNYRWGSSDRFYKLADQYYGDSTYWWIIAYFNNTPLESDVRMGQKILIPTPLEMILKAMGY